MTTVNYSNKRSYLGHRPYSNVTLLGVGGNPDVNFSALVDTGADYLQLPASAANTVGINLSSGVSQNVHGATGTAALIFLTGIDVEIEGKDVVVDAFFDPTNLTIPLLGRQALLAAVEAGFNTSEWLWE